MSSHDPQMSELLAEMKALRATVDAQQSELDALREAAARPVARTAAPVAVVEAPVPDGLSRRRILSLAGATVAGLGVGVLSSASPAAAADGDNLVLGQANDATQATTLAAGATTGTLSTTNTATGVGIAGTANALKGAITDASNGSHAVLGTTAGDGHAVAGVISKLDSPRAATWGRHMGNGAGAEGENFATAITDPKPAILAGAGTAHGARGFIKEATNASAAVLGETPGSGAAVYGVNATTNAVAIAGPANAVRGEITKATNGSHAVLGTTAGDGHAVAGVISKADSARSATWGRHEGSGAGIGGISVGGLGGEFIGKDAQIRLIPPTTAITGPPATAHKAGTLLFDSAGDLFLKTADSSLATDWALLNAPATVVLDLPKRAYDSRVGGTGGVQGRLGRRATRTIDLTQSSAIPAGVASVEVNITVTETVGAGYLSTYAAGQTVSTPAFSLLNWQNGASVVANSTTVKVTNGQIKIYADNATHVIVDVLAYTLA